MINHFWIFRLKGSTSFHWIHDISLSPHSIEAAIGGRQSKSQEEDLEVIEILILMNNALSAHLLNQNNRRKCSQKQYLFKWWFISRFHSSPCVSLPPNISHIEILKDLPKLSSYFCRLTKITCELLILREYCDVLAKKGWKVFQ